MKTGVGFIPGTFPTGLVRNAIAEGLPESGLNWTRNKVNDLFYLYSDGIEAGFPVVKQGNFAVMDYMMENSNYSESEIRVFLYYLLTLANSGEIEKKWLNPKLAAKSSSPIIRAITPANSFSQTVEKTAGAVKWGSIALLALAGIYFLWPVLKRVRKI